MSVPTFDVGDRVTLKAAFTSRPLTATEALAFTATGVLPEGAAVDPTTVVCTVLAPRRTTTQPATSKESAGIYKASVEPDAPGTWHYAFDGEGAYVAAAEGEFSVREQRVPR